MALKLKKPSLLKSGLNQIVSAIDGNTVYEGCGLGFNNCSEIKPCPVHHKFKLIRDDLKQMLETTSLLDLSKDVNNGMTFLKPKQNGHRNKTTMNIFKRVKNAKSLK